jgi:hypothetical protein
MGEVTVVVFMCDSLHIPGRGWGGLAWAQCACAGAESIKPNTFSLLPNQCRVRCISFYNVISCQIVDALANNFGMW